MSPTDAHEATRLALLERLRLHEAGDTGLLQGLVRAAATALGCRLAMINIVGARHSWSLARAGNDQPATEAALQALHRLDLCRQAIATAAGGGLLQIHDTWALAAPAADGPAAAPRFYAAVPLQLQGIRLGTLCVADLAPRQLQAGQHQVLVELARAASCWLAQRDDSLRQQQALQQARADHAAKGEFLATLGHEVRTPMNGILGLVELLQHSRLQRWQRELAGSVAASTRGLLHLVDDALDLSRIEANRLRIAPTPLDLAELVESAAQAHQPLARQRGVDLHVFVDPGLPPRLLADGLRLRQILDNLLGNAIKFCSGASGGGQIQLRAERLGPRRLRLQVSDNGLGIEAEVQQQLFQRFAQAGSDTAWRFGGSGLGLAICRHLAEAMQGRLSLQSAPGRGSRFSLDLPCEALAADPATASSALPELPLQGLRCRWVGPWHPACADWNRYLLAAGARVDAWPAPGQEPPAPTAGQGLPRLRIDAGSAGAAPGWLRLQAGRQRAPRRVADGLVQLDPQALRRESLCQAVLLAAQGAAALAADPVTERTAPAGRPAAATPPDDRRPVLVADDNEVNRLLIEGQLAHLGVPAVLVGDGLAALDALRQQPGRYSLLITDLNMPGLDGWGLAEAVRADPQLGPDLPILALTADARSTQLARCRRAGMQDCLHKPLALATLDASLRRWHAGTAALPAAAWRPNLSQPVPPAAPQPR
ncbi:MAG: response regulator [Burkholderiaceae bacterium]|nr:response regulator [Burkholderiaceae bacterium]